MRVVPVLGVLSGPEGSCPPLPFLDIDDTEAADKIKRGLVVAFDPADVVEAVEPEPVVEPVIEPVVEPVVEPVIEPVVAAETPNRAQSIRDAVELLDADDFEAKGPRKGKPAVDAVKAILGDEAGDLTAEEIDAAIAE